MTTPRVSQVPYGFRLGDGGFLEPYPDEQRARELIIE